MEDKFTNCTSFNSGPLFIPENNESKSIELKLSPPYEEHGAEIIYSTFLGMGGGDVSHVCG